MKDESPDRLRASSEDAALREMLEAGRTELPNEAQLAAVAKALGPILGGPGGGPGGASSAAPGARWWVATAKGVGIAGALAGSVWIGAHALAPPKAVPPPASVSTVTPALAPIPSDVPSAVPVAPLAPAMSAPPEVTATARATPRPAPSGEDEVTLVGHAQDALGASPTRALALADEEARRFPRGILRQEGEVIAIDALMRLGRRDAAEERARAFRIAYPTSTGLRRIDVLLRHDS
jgi:hypothetical protein